MRSLRIAPRTLSLLSVAWLAGASCTFDATPSAQARCTAEAPQCPGTTVCQVRLGLCVDGLEREAPRLVRVSLSPTAGTRRTRFRLTFTASEPLLVEPAVWAVFERGGRLPFTQVMRTGETFTFEFHAEQEQSAGQARAVVEVFDRSGNFGVLDDPPSFFVDATPPRASVAALALEPPLDSPLTRPRRLGPRVTALLSFSFDEPVTSDVTLLADPPVLAFTPEDAGTGQLTFRAQLAFGDGGLTQPVALSVRATDVLGNEATQPLQLTQPLVVDDAPVSATEDTRFVRAPFGSDEAPPPAFRVEGVTEPDALVRVLTLGGTELVRALADADGGFTASVPAPDRVAVQVDFTDTAANTTAARTVRRTRLVLTPNDVAEAATPATVLALGAAGPQLTRPDGQLQSGQAAAFPDSARLTVVGEASWRRLLSDVDPPLGCALTAHEARGTLLAFGGGTSSLAGDHLEWLDRAWRTQQRGPSVRGGAGYAYDRVRGVTVLFSGVNDSDVWEWDGDVWRLVPENAGDPLPRRFAAMVTDRRGVVLFGGVAVVGGAPRLDAWQRVGRTWRPVDAGTLPLHRTAAAFDLRTRRTLVLGQSADGGAVQTAWWDGDALEVLTLDGGPPAAEGPLGFDLETGTAHFLSNLGDGGAQAWTFAQGAWAQARPDTLPLGRASTSGAWDSATRELVSCGVPGSSPRSTVRYSPLDGGFVVGLSQNPKPPGRSNAAHAVGPDGGVVLFGGQQSSTSPPSDEVWRWSAGAWEARPGSALPLRNHTLALGADGGLYAFWGEFAPAGTVDFALDPRVQRQDEDGGWTVVFDRRLTDAGPPPRIGRATVVTEPNGLWLVSEGPSWRWTDDGWKPGPAASFTGGKVAASLLQPPDAGFFVLLGGARPSSSTPDDFLYFVTPLPDAGARWLAKGAPEVLKRVGAATWHDPIDGRHYLYGGVATSGVYRADVQVLTVNAALDGGVVVDGGVEAALVEASDPEGDGQPGIRQNMVAWFDAATGLPHMSGGRSDQTVVSDTWAFVQRSHRPAVQLRWAVNADASRATRLTVSVTAGGTGVDPAGPLDATAQSLSGFRVALWRGGRWEPLGTASFGVDAPARLTASLSVPQLEELLVPGAGLALQLSALGANGVGRAALVVDAVQLTLEQD